MNKNLVVFLTALTVAAHCCATTTNDHADIKAEAALMRRMSITSSNPQTQKYGDSMAR